MGDEYWGFGDGIGQRKRRARTADLGAYFENRATGRPAFDHYRRRGARDFYPVAVSYPFPISIDGGQSLTIPLSSENILFCEICLVDEF